MRMRDLPKHQRVSELLRQLGLDTITVEEFWTHMRAYGLTDVDIDKFCSGERVRD